MAKWNEYGLKSGTSAEDEVLILDSDTNTNKRTTVGDIQEFANGKVLEKENSTLNTEAKTLIGAINEVDTKNDAQDTKIEEVENKFSDYLKKTDVDSTLLVSGSPADAKVVGEQFKKSKEAIEELADKKITKFYASNQGNTHLPDSDKGKIQDMFLYGKSEQVQYKGKNLFDAKDLIGDKSVSNNGITFKYDSANDVFTISGTATQEAINAYLFGGYTNTNVIFTLSAGTYTFSTTLQTAVMYAYDGSARKTYIISSSGNTYTLDSEVGITALKPGNQVVGATVNQSFKIQIEKGSTKTDFEPYTGGIPSPNPDYPQEIKAVVNPKVVVRGKNLLKATAQTQTINGVTFTNNGDGTYTVNGTATADTLLVLCKTDIKANVNYRLVGCPSGGANAVYNMVMQDIVNWSTAFDNGSGITKSYSEDCTLRISIQIKSGVTVNNLIFKPMLSLEISDTYADYEPYTKQSAVLPYTLYAIPVSTGGNITIGNQQYVADYVDVERVKLVRMCKEIDFAKIKQASYDNSLTNTKESRYRYKELNLKVLAYSATYENGAGYVNRAFLANTTWGIDRDGIFSHGQGTQKEYVTLRIPKDKDAREYFTEIGGCKGVFQIDVSEEIDLTPEQIQAFKSLATNYPVTNIEVSSDQLDGYTVFNYPISMAEGWNYVKQQIGDTRDYIYDMDLQSAEAYVNSEYAVALTELEVM